MSNHMTVHLNNVLLVNGKRVEVSNASVLSNVMQLNKTQVSGIPLTEDELTRLSVQPKLIEAVSTETFKVYILKNALPHRVFLRFSDNTYKIVCVGEEEEVVVCEVKYVHELQNICAALTGFTLRA